VAGLKSDVGTIPHIGAHEILGHLAFYPKLVPVKVPFLFHRRIVALQVGKGTQVHGVGLRSIIILGLWRQMMKGFELALMMPSSCLFDINGDSATGHWYLQEHTRDREGNRAMLLSRYQDSCRREAGEWHYLRRDYQIIYHGDPDLSGAYMPL
jgi:hypothetical protein